MSFSRVLSLPAGRGGLRGRVIAIFGLLAAMNILAWGAAAYSFHASVLLLGSAVLAYSLGLRHAVDADHIAAIDNVTRKLMQEGQRPVGVGLFFSLGHSTIVFLLSIAVAAMAGFGQRLGLLRAMGGAVGMAFSSTFLLLLAGFNLVVLFGLLKAFRQVKQSGRFPEDDLNVLLAGRGLLGRLFFPLFRVVGRSWHMYFVGLLFGLGFDTASEVALLGLSAAGGLHGMNVWGILVFPALFTAGMALIDTADGVLMLGAYGWAFVDPLRKLYYNLAVTAVSVTVALLIGGLEALGLVRDWFDLPGPFWRAVGAVNAHFGLLGYAVIGLFLVGWLAAMLFYRWLGVDGAEIPATD
jgi:high-affinity nickel-transport protein